MNINFACNKDKGKRVENCSPLKIKQITIVIINSFCHNSRSNALI